jgi:hypothetical protein
MAVNWFASIKGSEAAAIENKDYDNRFFLTPGALFVMNLFCKGK